MSMNSAIAKLIAYAEKHLCLASRDAVYARNRILDILGLTTYEAVAIGDLPELPNTILQDIFSCLDEEGKEYDRATLGEKLMDAVMLRPSEFEHEFLLLCHRNSTVATEWAYSYAIHSDYVKKTAIDRNIQWHAENGLEITINLSKPEKNNKDLAKQLTTVSTDYPKCTICRENEGYERAGFSRRNMRTVSLKLGGEAWFWQYSPYAYFNEHGIAVSCKHTPMKLDHGTIEKLFDFVEQFPHYFIGNNAPLPRVGGSILMHDHFQGGRATLPMQKAAIRATLTSARHPSVRAGVLNWDNTAFRLEGENRYEIAALAMELIEAWQTYENRDADIVPFTGDEPHNTASCIARYTASGYILDIILRNNRMSEEHPDGIFHAHKEYHAIKSESIGLIEAMGLFILPARLYRQLAEVKDYLTGKKPALEGDSIIFSEIAERLKADSVLTDVEAEARIKREVEDTCKAILDNTAVFKRNEIGERGLCQLLAKTGLHIIGGRL